MHKLSKVIVLVSVILNLALCTVLGWVAYQKLWIPHQKNQDALHGPPGIELEWHNLEKFEVEGKGWKQAAGHYTRLPAEAQSVVSPEIWELGRQSAGLKVRFVSDATSLYIRWTLSFNDLDSPNMAATGFSGLDLYVRKNDGWSWAAVGQPYQFPHNRSRLLHNLPPGRREYMLYLPNCNGIESIQLGVPPGASCTSFSAGESRAKPIVFYGTSITQGAVASRPGMSYPAILERRLGWPAVNLGFSGQGEMQPEVVKLLAEVDAAAYVIDCLPNMTIEQVTQRTQPLVKTLRRAHPTTPIILVERHAYAYHIDTTTVTKVRRQNAALHSEFAALQRSGVRHLYYLTGDSLIGRGDEATADGTHFTDLGFHRMANSLEPVLRKALKIL